MQFLGLDKHIRLGFRPIFIGGPGRTGTSLLHASLCTDFEDNNTHEYIGEAMYLSGIFKSFLDGDRMYEGITSTYFKDYEEFALYHSNLMKTVLIDIWKYMGEPKKLIMKNPKLSFLFYMIAQLVPESKLLLTVRHPLDMAASWKNVLINKRDDVDYNLDALKEVCKMDINFFYDTIYEQMDLIEDKLMIVKYEDFVNDKLDDELFEFTGIRIRKENLWKSNKHKSESGWLTDLYKAPRQNTSIGNYKDQLTDEEIEAVLNISGHVFDRFSYERP